MAGVTQISAMEIVNHAFIRGLDSTGEKTKSSFSFLATLFLIT
jgi:hypothetical protein